MRNKKSPFTHNNPSVQNMNFELTHYDFVLISIFMSVLRISLILIDFSWYSKHQVYASKSWLEDF